MASEPPPAVILTVNAIVGGVFFHAGTPTPYASEADLPASLKPFVATAEAPPPEPVERNIYDMPLSLKRQVGKLQLAAAEKAWAEKQAAEPLRQDVAAALEDAHDRSVSIAKAQKKYNDRLTDAAYAQATARGRTDPALRQTWWRMGPRRTRKTQARRNRVREARERRNGGHRHRR